MIEFDQKIDKIGADYVALRDVDRNTVIDMGGIVLSETDLANNKLGYYQVEAVGSNAEKEYGLKVGDYVLADNLAKFYKSTPVCLMKYVNVIIKTNKDKTEYKPLKNMVLVKKANPDVDSFDGIYVQKERFFANIGEIVDKNIADGVDFPFEIGDKVLLTTGADVIDIGKNNYFIYKHDMIICKIED